MFVGVMLGRVCVIILLNDFLCRLLSNVIIFKVFDMIVFLDYDVGKIG